MARKPNSAEETKDRKEEILTAAVSVFSEKGYAGATTSEVAKVAGIAEGTVFRYFRTKKELLSAIVMKFVNSVSSTIVLGGVQKIVAESEGKDFRVILKEILMDRLRLLRHMMPVFQVVLTEALYHPEIRTAMYENVYKRALETVKPLFDRLEQEGTYRGGIGRNTIMRTFMGAFAGLLGQCVLTGMDGRTFEEEADLTIDLLYHGLIRQKDNDNDKQ
jgi:AcrR family transcriptional regulator